MNIKNLKIAIVITLIALPCFAVKVYQNLNMTDQNITNVPNPVADNNAVNNEYIEKLVDKLYDATNLVAATAKCAGGQISGYTPIPGEDLYSNMQYGVDWTNNTRFTVDSTGSNVLDNLTGLMWTKNANIGGTKTWTNAIDFCTNLVYGGYSDWRLPNRIELYSLIDFSKYNPALPSGHPFISVQSGVYWSSSTHAGSADLAWVVRLYYGAVGSHSKTISSYVWPVRSR